MIISLVKRIRTLWALAGQLTVYTVPVIGGGCDISVEMNGTRVTFGASGDLRVDVKRDFMTTYELCFNQCKEEFRQEIRRRYEEGGTQAVELYLISLQPSEEAVCSL